MSELKIKANHGKPTFDLWYIYSNNKSNIIVQGAPLHFICLSFSSEHFYHWSTHHSYCFLSAQPPWRIPTSIRLSGYPLLHTFFYLLSSACTVWRGTDTSWTLSWSHYWPLYQESIFWLIYWLWIAAGVWWNPQLQAFMATLLYSFGAISLA